MALNTKSFGDSAIYRSGFYGTMWCGCGPAGCLRVFGCSSFIMPRVAHALAKAVRQKAVRQTWSFDRRGFGTGWFGLNPCH
jgi:hypothetical protein